MYTLVQENLHALQAEQQIGKIYKYVKVICNVIFYCRDNKDY